MKIEDLAYRIAGETLLLLERDFHYHVAPEHKKEIQTRIRDGVGKIIQQTAKS